ncbi:hypothetical protein [Bradyrhizobium canariense]
MSWFLFGYISGWGSVYEFEVKNKLSEKEYLDSGAVSAITDSLRNQFRIAVYVSDTPVIFIQLKHTDDGLGFAWQYPYSAWPEIKRREGLAVISRTRSILTVYNSFIPIPGVKNVTIETPTGTISPFLKQIISFGAQRSGLEIDQSQLANIISALEQRLLYDAGLKVAYDQALGSAFWAGEVQFLTLVCFIFYILLKLIGVITKRLSELCGFTLEIMPYLGFYGTLLGMGSALQILGFADVSDNLRKAISLGPIGSQMGLAVETTKFALVLYLTGGLAGNLLDILSEKVRAKLARVGS